MQGQPVARRCRLAERRARLDEARQGRAHGERTGGTSATASSSRSVVATAQASDAAPPSVDGDGHVRDPMRLNASPTVVARRCHGVSKPARLALDRARRAIGIARDRVAALAARERDERNGASRYASRSARPTTLIALERPSSMLLPECPPRPPARAHRRASPHRRRGLARLFDPDPRSVLPAHPTVNLPSSSLSRLIRIAPPATSFRSSPFAPSRPTSSATVISSSSGPWGVRLILGEGHHRRDRDAVVGAQRCPVRRQPLAVAKSSIRPSAGIVGLLGSRSQTMSRWPCRVISGPPPGPRSPAPRPRGSRPRRPRTEAVLDRPRTGHGRSPAPPGERDARSS